MFLRMPCILVTATLLAVAAAQQETDELFGTFLQEDFFFAPDNNNDQGPHGHLRRQLQQSCRPIQYAATNGDCSGTYPCTCNGVTTECPYCSVQTSSVAGTVCQQSGVSSTFTFNRNSPEIQTCSCNYYGSGNAVSTCGPQTLPGAPVPVPVPVPAPAPTPVNRADGSPSSGVPVPSSLSPLGCHAITPYNPRICLGTPDECAQYGASCDIMGQHPCECTGSSDTMCSYCQVQTATEIFCQVVGSSSTFTDVDDGITKTCTCDYAGDGKAVQTCTPAAMGISEMP